MKMLLHYDCNMIIYAMLLHVLNGISIPGTEDYPYVQCFKKVVKSVACYKQGSHW